MISWEYRAQTRRGTVFRGPNRAWWCF